MDIQCDDGWYELIWELFTKIEKEFKNNNASLDSLHVLKIKERDCALSVFLSEYPGRTIKIIDDFEKESKRVCEYCGGKSEVTIKRDREGMLKTLCRRCGDELGFKIQHYK